MKKMVRQKIQKEKNITKERLLQKGAEIIHLKGYNHTGINEILEAAQVPKGSFYFYFKSKEDFGIQLIDFFMQRFLGAADRFIADTSLPYLDRFRNFFDDFLQFFESCRFVGGCPIGNFALEMADLNEKFRDKLDNSFEKMKSKIRMYLEGALENGELADGLDINEMSDFILNSWEGALLRMKVTQTNGQMMLFYKMVFDRLLRMPNAA
jgi:TetR/AcrR family transcriptional repressor of nem operon